MKIGVIGGGRVGGALAASWRAAGHDVTVATRDTVGETAAGAEVVLLAIPARAVPEALAAMGDLGGKILVDATNNLSGGPDGSEIARLAGAGRTVKAFNTVFAQFFASPPAEPPSLVLAGDDAAAKEVVGGLVRDAGFDPIDAGDGRTTPDVEAFARLLIGIGYAQGHGPFVYRFASS